MLFLTWLVGGALLIWATTGAFFFLHILYSDEYPPHEPKYYWKLGALAICCGPIIWFVLGVVGAVCFCVWFIYTVTKPWHKQIWKATETSIDVITPYWRKYTLPIRRSIDRIEKWVNN